MSSKVSTKNKILKSLSQANWKAFLFFTSFTFFLWLILQFTKTHKVDYEISIILSEIPVKEVLSDNQIKLSTTIEQTGFTLFKKQFSENSISLPVSALQKKDSAYVFQSSLFVAQIASELKLSLDHFSINTKDFGIPFTIKSSKKIPLVTNVNIGYAKSFASYVGLQIDRDSIKIAGPTDVISAISSIETEEVTLDELRKDKSGKLKLMKPFSDVVILEFENVNYNIEVEKFTEQSFSLPIELKNTPENYNVLLIPERVTVKFQSSLEDMENISEEDFQIECDFNSALNEISLLIPKLVNQPQKAIRSQLEPNRIEYILRK
jgi:hypothetical protein